MTSSPHPPAARALVVGGSLAGLLAARVLADHFSDVTVVERDRYPAGPGPRRGVPQARHVHVLLTGGRIALDCLFPGLIDELLRAGAVPLDVAQDVRWLSPSGWGPRFHSGITTISCSRDLIEWAVRRRLAARPEVRWIEEAAVRGLVLGAHREVAGVLVRERGQPSQGTTLAAELVVDASGRRSQAPNWLAALGFPPPPETTVNSFLAYASRWYEQPEGVDRLVGWQGLLLQTQPPHMARGGALVPIEGQRWLVTLSGAARDYPPTDEAGFMAFAQSLRDVCLYNAIRQARPLGPIHGYRRTANRMRHYERLARWPEGFLVLGDAVCAFNPLYGQGITVAARAAQVLDRCLRGPRRGLGPRFQRALARSLATPWLMATGEDYRYPTTEGGRRGRLTKLMHGYVDQVQALAVSDTRAFTAMMQVLHLVKSPAALFHPALLAPALARAWRTAKR